MKLSARNQFRGTVTKIKKGEVMGEVTVKVGDIEVVAAITMGSVKSMGLKVKDTVTVAVKATEVLVAKCWNIQRRGPLDPGAPRARAGRSPRRSCSPSCAACACTRTSRARSWSAPASPARACSC